MIFSPAPTLPVMLTIATFGFPASSCPTVSPRPSTVKDAFRQANLIDDFGKRDGVVWGKFARFDNDGVAGDQRGSKLTGNQEEGKVPRQNAGGDAKGTLKHQNILARTVALNDFPSYRRAHSAI